MAAIKWTVSILMQYYDNEAFAHDDLMKVILKNSLNHDIIKFFIFKHEVAKGRATISTVRRNDAGDYEYEVLEPEFECRDFFANAARYWGPFLQRYPGTLNADCNFVITTGHGAGFGFTDGFLPEAKALESGTDRPSRPWGSYIQQLLTQGLIDFDTEKVRHTLNALYDSDAFFPGDEKARVNVDQFRIIPICHVADAFAYGFGNRKVDLFYTSNCDMQLFETGYTLKDVVKHYAASETFQYPTGIDFEKVFIELGNIEKTEKGRHLQAVADNITTNLPVKYNDPAVITLLRNNIKDFDPSTVSYMSLSVNNLELYPEVRERLDRVAEWLINNNASGIYDSLRRIRYCCRDVAAGSPLGIIDIVNFCNVLKTKLPADEELGTRLDGLCAFFDLKKPGGSLLTSAFFAKGTRGTRSAYAINPYGVTFFFPRDNKYLKDQYTVYFIDNFYKKKAYLSLFLEHSTWDNFVVKYYEYFQKPIPMVNCP